MIVLLSSIIHPVNFDSLELSILQEDQRWRDQVGASFAHLKRQWYLQVWTAWGQGLPSPPQSDCCPAFSFCCDGVMVTESKSDVGVGTWKCALSFEPPFTSCWWGFHFRLPDPKRAKCKVTGFTDAVHVAQEVGCTHPPSDSCRVSSCQPGWLENPWPWGWVVILLFFPSLTRMVI